MASYVSNLVHFVWATANRAPLIKDAWRNRLHGYLGGVAKSKNALLVTVGSMADHVHACVSLPATVSIAQMANALKANSSRWVHENIDGGQRFRWQEGYGAFSVSKSGIADVKRYIQNQSEHHRRRSFREEFVALLKKHGIEYDESRL